MTVTCIDHDPDNLPIVTLSEEWPEPEQTPLYLGLDLSAENAHYAATSDGITFTIEGQVTPETFGTLLAALKPTAIGMEYSGRLAEKWCDIAWQRHTETYIIHSVLRKTLTRLHRQTAKSDKADAQTIAKNLRLWHTEAFRDALGIPCDLFTSASTVRAAWVLRAFLADAEALDRQRFACENRIRQSELVGMPERGAIWGSMARQCELAAAEARGRCTAYVLAHFNPEYELLLSVLYVGDRLAMALIASLYPIERFRETHPQTGKDITIRNIKRYIGFLPHLKQSGSSLNESKRPMHRGDNRLRSLATVCARGCAIKDRNDDFALLYQKCIERGLKGKQAINRCATAIIRVAVAVWLRGTPYKDARKPEAKPGLPDHLIPQSEAAKSLGVSRQRVHQMVEQGQLRATEWQPLNSTGEPLGPLRRYVIARYLDLLIDQRKTGKVE